jgi:hypothetical protein
MSGRIEPELTRIVAGALPGARLVRVETLGSDDALAGAQRTPRRQATAFRGVSTWSLTELCKASSCTALAKVLLGMIDAPTGPLSCCSRQIPESIGYGSAASIVSCRSFSRSRTLRSHAR